MYLLNVMLSGKAIDWLQQFRSDPLIGSFFHYFLKQLIEVFEYPVEGWNILS